YPRQVPDATRPCHPRFRRRQPRHQQAVAMTDDELAAILNFVEQTVGGRWICAGGAARDRLLNRAPRDIDLFGLEMSGQWKDVTARLRKAHVPYTVKAKQYGVPGDRQLFDPCVIVNVLGYEVNLICTPKTSAVQIIETFDFN